MTAAYKKCFLFFFLFSKLEKFKAYQMNTLKKKNLLQLELLHWLTQFNFFFVPWTSIGELSSISYAEFRYVYRIFSIRQGFKDIEEFKCKIVLYVLKKQAETFP